MNKIEKQIIKELIKYKPTTKTELGKFKRKMSARFDIPMLTNIELIRYYRQSVKNQLVKPDENLEKLMIKREIRTLSGVAVVAVLTKSYPCPGKCVYCPTEQDMPKSYLSNEPAVMRAILTKFNPFRQVKCRLDALEMTGHQTDKVELIIMGGTWTCLPKKYQTWFIKRCFDACNKKTSKTLKEAQKINEKAKHRVIGLTLETRPDYITLDEIKRMRELGCTKVEMGVQSLDNSILQLNKRGHKTEQTILATKLLKDAGFKIAYHMMPDLPGATPAKDLKMFKQLFSGPAYQPDMLKIYPCVVVKGSTLYKWWKNGKYKTYSEKVLRKLLIDIKTSLPYYVRVIRLIRDIPAESIEAGNKVSNLRDLLQKEMEEKGLYCKCIRCREARKQVTNINEAKLFTDKYPASDGTEYFLSYASKDRKVLYAFLRLRISSQDGEVQGFYPELKNSALIREVHTYGQLVPIKEKGGKTVQHVGFGKKLMAEAEKITKKEKLNRLAVISGIGVRQYYKKLGYKLEGTYMVKNLKK